MGDTPDFTQDPMFPPDWWAWDTGAGAEWHARPPGRANPLDYVHGTSKEECADRAWREYRRRVDAAEGDGSVPQRQDHRATNARGFSNQIGL